MRLLVIPLDLFKSTTSAFHQIHSAKKICNYRISSFWSNCICIKILHKRTIKHTAWWINLHTIIKNINMYLAAKLRIISMNQRIDQTFHSCTFRILWHFQSAISKLFPTHFSVIFYELNTILQQTQQTATIFSIIPCLHNPRCFIKTKPTSTEKTWITHRRFISKQNSGIRKHMIRIRQTTRNKIL